MEYHYEPKLTKFNGIKDDDYNLYTMRLKVAHRSRELETALTDGGATALTSERALAITINGFGRQTSACNTGLRNREDGQGELDPTIRRQVMINRLSTLQ